jgi:hypothetical protein
VFVLNLVYAYSRPYVDTFVLPGWLETTVFSQPATRVWSALAMLMLVAAFYVMFTWRDAKSRVHQGD